MAFLEPLLELLRLQQCYQSVHGFGSLHLLSKDENEDEHEDEHHDHDHDHDHDHHDHEHHDHDNSLLSSLLSVLLVKQLLSSVP